MNQSELMKKAFREMMKSVGTSIPGHVIAFDADTQLAQIQIGIEKVDIAGVTFDPAPLIECPVFIYGGDYLIETQIDPGTTGVILFSQRCIDGWINTGGIAQNPILRFHDISDAYFLPGLRAQPDKIPSYDNNGIKIRNKNGTRYIWLKSDGTAIMDVVSLHVTGPITSDGEITADADGGAVQLTQHVHTGVVAGGALSGIPDQ